MNVLTLSKQAQRFIKKLPQKQACQLVTAIDSLQQNPHQHDVRPLQGYKPYLRKDCGEYRIIYRYEIDKQLVTVVLVGKRNDDAIYRIAKRTLK